MLFADLSGYTSLTEAVDPEEVAALLNTILSEAGRIVEAYGGTVNQFAGDQVKALFGIPAAHDDDPRRAVTAALELHQFIRRLDAKERPRLGHPLRLHSAINTGLVVTQRRDSREGVFGLTGDTVNTAARLLAKAGPDEILIGPATYEAVELYYQTERVGDLALAGKRLPIAVHRVTEAREHTRFEAAQRRGLSTYAGREREHARLDQCLAQLRSGRGRFVVVVGQPGLGKSRFLHELGRYIDQAEFAVVSGRCEPYGNVSPYQPFIHALQALLLPREAAVASDPAGEVAGRLRAIAPELEQYLDLYLHLLSVGSRTSTPFDGLRDQKLRLALQDALAALLSRHACLRPTVLLLEDWHWADDASDAALRHVARYVSSHPLLLVVSQRPGTANWDALRPFVLTLQPLDSAETEVVAASRLGARDLPPELVSFVHERTAGNPFFVEELCRALRESGAVSGSEGTVVLTRTPSEFPTPESVQAVVRARIDRLPTGPRELLRRASILGKRFPLSLLKEIADPTDAVQTDLHRLEDAELLERHGDEDDLRYAFRHVIVQEVAYDTLLLQERRDLHARAARAIETRHAGQLDRHVEALANHYGRSGDLEQAALWEERAGDKAARAFSLREVQRHYRRAIDALDRGEPTADRVRRRVDVSVKWGEACVYQPAPEHVAILRKSYDQAMQLEYHAGALRNLYWLAWVEHAIGDHRACYEHSERCLELVTPLGDHALEARLTFNLGQESYHFTEYNRAATLLDQAIALRRASGHRGGTTVLASSLGYLALVDVERGAFPDAYRRFNEALGMIRRAGQLQLEATVTTMLGYAQIFQGEWVAARETCDRIRTLNERLDSAAVRAMSDTIEGVARFHEGEVGRGIEILRRAVTEHESSGARMALSVAYAELAIALARSGSADEASALAGKALARCEVGDCPGEVAALRALAWAAVPEWSNAVRYIDEATRRAAAKDSRREQTVTHLTRAQLLHAAGDLMRAAEVAAPLVVEFEEMGMRWHLAQARATAASPGAN